MFRHHLETTVNEIRELKDSAYKSIRSLTPISSIVKVRINHLGKIVSIGEIINSKI
jgi:CRISPR-associated endonuclease Csn1